MPVIKEQINLNSLLQLIEEVLLVEAVFNISDITKRKYFDPLLMKLQNKEPILLEPDSPDQQPEELIVDIESDKGIEFLKNLTDTNADKLKLDLLFKKGPNFIKVIPGTDGKDYSLAQISKSTFTARPTKSGLLGTETPEMKEGLASYFAIAGPDSWMPAEEKIKNNGSEILNLHMQMIDAKYFGVKSASLTSSAIDHLNNNQITDKKEKSLFLQAISVAKTMSTFGKNIVDRGVLFEKIRKAALDITKLSKPDKWNPADLYVYDAGAEIIIEQIVDSSTKNNAIVSILDADDKIIQIGLNSLFEGSSPIIHALSLKEESSFSGRATSFLKIRNVSGTQLSKSVFKIPDEEIEILKVYQDRIIPGAKEKILIYEAKYLKRKEDFVDTLMRNPEYKINEVKDIRSSTQKQFKNDEHKLGNLIRKANCFEFMTSFLNDFENLKHVNQSMSAYTNPMLALTAYGVSLSGFNPTFKKITASSTGNETMPVIFAGRDSLRMESKSVTINDTPTKAGFIFSFVTKMGEKEYKAALDIRFDGDVSISIIVEDFKEA